MQKINQKLPMMTKPLTRLFLTILGTIFFITFIWYRFIRERLPKDIPFHLTEYGCLILMYICCLYFFIIIILIITFQVKNSKLNVIVEMIYKPLKVLDESFKMHTFIDYYHNKIIEFSINIRSKVNYTYIYYSFNIVPRLVLVTVLLFDIFYFTKIENLYKIILLGLLPLLYKYIIYSFKYAKELYILNLESITDKIMTNGQEDSKSTGWVFLNIRDFINIQTNSIFYNNHTFHCNPIPTFEYSEKVREIKSIKDKQKKHQDLINKIIPLSVSLEEFDLRHNFNNKIKYIKIGIFSTYLICWSYILIISLPLLPDNAFQLLWIIQDTQEPFSLTDLTSTLIKEYINNTNKS